MNTSNTFSLRTSILLLAYVSLAPHRKYTTQQIGKKTPVAPLCEWINRLQYLVSCVCLEKWKASIENSHWCMAMHCLGCNWHAQTVAAHSVASLKVSARQRRIWSVGLSCMVASVWHIYYFSSMLLADRKCIRKANVHTASSPLIGGYLTRFNKIAIQVAPQMAVDKEAISLSRVYSYYSKCNMPLFYV